MPEKAGNIEVAWCPPGGISSSDPMGTPTPPTVIASAPLPSGTFDAKWVEVKLAATDWLKAVNAAAAKDPKEAAEIAKAGPVLPGTARATIRTTAKAGASRGNDEFFAPLLDRGREARSDCGNGSAGLSIAER